MTPEEKLDAIRQMCAESEADAQGYRDSLKPWQRNDVVSPMLYVADVLAVLDGGAR